MDCFDRIVFEEFLSVTEHSSADSMSNHHYLNLEKLDFWYNFFLLVAVIPM